MTEVTTQQNKEQLLHFMYGFDDYAYADPSPYYPEIEAIRTGQFTDMNGKPITIDIALLDALVENFANNKAGQEIPIDLNHERKEAAGWLLGVRRLNNSLFVAPNWNELGLSMVHSKQYRYVSCTIDLVEKYLLSVSLTNFPAVNNMRPIELSRMNEGASSSLIVLFQKPEESMAKDVNVKPTEEKVPPAESESKTPPAELSASATPATPVTKSDIPNRDEVVAQFRQQADAEIASIRKQLNDLLGDLQAQRQAAVADFMSQVRTERQIAEFSERVTSTGKHAIPAKPADVAAVLSALPAANREAVQNLLESIYAGGTVDFSEMGTSAGKPIAETVQLSSEWQRVLRSHISTGGTVDEFFSLNADLLGDKGKYDLGAFAKKEG
jgi:phage I-like protein